MKKNRLFTKLMSAVTVCAVTLGSLSLPVNAGSDDLTGKTAMEITQMMGKGWNLGNTFDADGGNRSDVYSQEQSWGNPIVTKELIDGVKAMGFDTIRIPVTWFKHVDKNNNFAIDEAFMARVTEVVNYAYDNDMFIILNMHHEAWLNKKTIDTEYEAIGKELVAIWTQIADNFADYDQHLIFEGMNEPRAKDTSHEWTGTKACYDAVNYLDQLFVETVRANGKGHNPERALMIPGYAASNSKEVLKSIVIPTINGAQAENIIISVHCYSPYNFCLSDNQATFNPKSSNDTSDITNMMSNLKTLFLNNGIPVVIGECGATNTKDNDDARITWFKYFGDITREANVPALVWDNGARGNSGGECHNYFMRKTGEPAYPALLNAFIFGDVDGGELKNLFVDFEPYKEGGETVLVNPKDVGFTSVKLQKATKINHTEDATVGFSLIVDTKVADNTASMDISKYAGQKVKVSAWIKSDAPETAEIGISNTDAKISGEANEEWTKATIYYEIPADASDVTIFFKCTSKIYVDDISVELVDALGDNSFGEANTQVEENKESSETIVLTNPASENSSNNSSNNSASTLIAIACISIGLIVVVLVVTRLAKKKKANK